MNAQGAVGIRRIDANALRDVASDSGGRLIYAVGDIHGSYDLLVRLLEEIVADVGEHPAPAVLLVFCGDYVDRGPDTAKVLTTLIWLSRYSVFDVVFLKGNHEAMLLDFLVSPYAMRGWLKVGGAETLASYDVALPEGDLDDAACLRLRDALMDALPSSHLSFVERLALSRVAGDYVFVHAGLKPGVPIADQDEEDLLWIRDAFLEADGPFEKIVVHGHTWHSVEPDVTRGRIGIDTGAYSTGVLTAVRLHGASVGFIQAYETGRAGPDRLKRDFREDDVSDH